MTTPFKQALTLLRYLADMQNGAPLMSYEKEYNELMQQVYDFLNEHEAQVKPDSIEEYYMTVGKLDEMKAKVRAFENSFGSSIFPSAEAIARLIKEPLPLKKRELNRSIQWSGKDGELTSLVAKIAKQYQSEGRKGSILPIGFIQRKKDEKHPLFEDVPETTIPQGMHPKTWAFLTSDYMEEEDKWVPKEYPKITPFGIVDED